MNWLIDTNSLSSHKYSKSNIGIVATTQENYYRTRKMYFTTYDNAALSRRYWHHPDPFVGGSPSKNKSSVLNLLNEGKPASERRRKRAFSCYDYFKEFTNNTSLHGLKYLGEKRPIVEKLWWTVMFVLCTAACAHLIFKVWDKWNQSPVIVSFAETSTPVWQIPFPAVTICSETKAKQSIYNFTRMFHKASEDNGMNMTDEERDLYEQVSLVCDSHMVQTGKNFTNNSVVETLTSMAPQFDEMMWFCKWKTYQVDCSKLFTPILTEDGLCFTFNTLTASELLKAEVLHNEYQYLNHSRKSKGWTLDGGYPDHVPLETYPFRGTGAGAKAGLTILLRAYTHDLDFLCRGPVQGFKVALHTPAEMPKVSTQFFRVPLGQEVVAAVKPNMMTTSEGLRNYDPARRQCFFPSERKLKYFNVYTQNNCELECLTNYTLYLCDCVTFSMPRNETVPICSSGSSKCVSDATDDLLTRGIRKGLRDQTVLDEGNEWGKDETTLDRLAGQCNCLPACTSINYDVEISQADFDWQNLFSAYKLNTSEMENLDMARFGLQFKESQFITSRRSELYGQTDFLANCGGLLGLCMGFSILSLVEIIYFITLRAVCNLKKRVSREKGGGYHNNIASVEPMEPIDKGDLKL